MTKRMSPIVKLAREICWAGFVHPDAKIGKTKASYWKSLPEDTQASYVADATWVAYLLKHVSVDVLNELNELE